MNFVADLIHKTFKIYVHLSAILNAQCTLLIRSLATNFMYPRNRDVSLNLQKLKLKKYNCWLNSSLNHNSNPGPLAYHAAQPIELFRPEILTDSHTPVN